MKIHCFKYHGAGNDFILIDNRNQNIELSSNQVSFLCNRHIGIGADGLMLLNASEQNSFSMKYYNSDGYEGSMCGNGGRVISKFATDLGIESLRFDAVDGLHNSQLIENNQAKALVEIQLCNVNKIETVAENIFFLNTGSPHLVIFLDTKESLNNYDVVTKGRSWRSDTRFVRGTNVNFVKILNNNSIEIRTYERGVEDETLACGTGATASALAFSQISKNKTNEVDVFARGGRLKVKFVEDKRGTYEKISLTGEAEFVFECYIDIK